MSKLPIPNRTSAGIAMMVGVVVVLAIGAILVNKRDDGSQVIATANLAPSSTQINPSSTDAASNGGSTTDSPISPGGAGSASSEDPLATTAPTSSGSDSANSAAASVPTAATPAAPTNTTTIDATLAPTSSITTTASSSTTTTAFASSTTSDVDAQATTSTSESVASTTTSTTPANATTSTTPTTEAQPDLPIIANPVTVNVASGSYAMPPSGSVTIILPKGTADPSVTGPLLLIRITSLVDTNDERWELRSNGAGEGTVTARTATTTSVWTIVTPAPGY